MLKQFYPDEYVDSTYQIDFEKYYNEGYRGVIFDIDNTLVEHGAPADERAVALFGRLKSIGFSATLLSNNKEPRVKMFFDGVCADHYIYRAGKPAVKNYVKAMELMGCDKSNTLFVGTRFLRMYMVRKGQGFMVFL